MLIRNAALATVAILLTGCAGFSGKPLPSIETSTPVSTEYRPTVSYRIDFDGNMDIRDSQKIKDLIYGDFQRQLQITNCCELTSNEQKSDLKIVAKIDKYENPAALIPAVITGATLYIIPSWATYDYSMKADVSTSTGFTSNFNVNDHWTLVQWFPMMLAFPFNLPNNAEENVFSNINKNLLWQMRQQKML